MTEPLVKVHPQTILWAAERSAVSLPDLAAKFPKFLEWGNGDTYPTFKELEKFAKATKTPIGSLFLSNPPEYKVPIADYRKRRGVPDSAPSRELEDTLNSYLKVQDWYREYANTHSLKPNPIIGSRRAFDPITEVADEAREFLDFEVSRRTRLTDTDDVYRHLVARMDSAGILVGKAGIVGTSTRRTLDRDEFGGFAFYDEIAPLIFVNGKDFENSHIFTLVHEFIHLMIGESALTDSPLKTTHGSSGQIHRLERWCNQVTAEVLVPKNDLKQSFDSNADLGLDVHRLSLKYRVSNLVVAYSLRDANLISSSQLRQLEKGLSEEFHARESTRKKTGGSFYRNQIARLGRRFTNALISETLEGSTLYSEASSFLGSSKTSSLKGIALELRSK